MAIILNSLSIEPKIVQRNSQAFMDSICIFILWDIAPTLSQMLVLV